MAVPPITDLDRTLATTVTGGFVYRGTQGTLPLGSYLFGDFGTTRVFLYQSGARETLIDDSVVASGETDPVVERPTHDGYAARRAHQGGPAQFGGLRDDLRIDIGDADGKALLEAPAARVGDLNGDRVRGGLFEIEQQAVPHDEAGPVDRKPGACIVEQREGERIAGIRVDRRQRTDQRAVRTEFVDRRAGQNDAGRRLAAHIDGDRIGVARIGLVRCRDDQHVGADESGS